MAKDISAVRVHKLTCDYVPLKGDECRKDAVYVILIDTIEYAITCELHCNIIQQEAIYTLDHH